jgi:hypothetical protein
MPEAAMELDPFSLLDEALALDKENTGPVELQRHLVAYLPDGDVHVCKGPLCPFVELNVDKCYTCTLSGFVFGVMSVREDFSTGRQAGSSNPDDHAGEPVGGQWRPKKDLAGMSNAAMNSASTLEDDGAECAAGAEGAFSPKLVPTPGVQSEGPKVVKRGARCVTEDFDAPSVPPKRVRSSRGTSDRERFRTLSEDAEATLSKLVNFEKRSEAKSAKPRDARLMDRAALFELSFKKYCKECLASGTAPSLDDIHNISLAAARVAAEEKRKAALEGGRKALLLKVRIREQVSSLAVCLWQASCKTPYMASARKGADSFRPFVCGSFYALKRGVSLPDGTVVLPACPELAEALPALRSTAAGSAAKALHASSHRGLCTLHRSISSCTPDQASELYGDCARLASQLVACVKSGNYDLC